MLLVLRVDVALLFAIDGNYCPYLHKVWQDSVTHLGEETDRLAVT